MTKVYQVKKIMVSKGQSQHVLLLDSQGVVYETSCIGESTKLCQLLNTNSDNKCRYEIITINNK
jgi:hypothetical protein